MIAAAVAIHAIVRKGLAGLQLLPCKPRVTLPLRLCRSGRYHYFCSQRPCSLSWPSALLAPGAKKDEIHSRVSPSRVGFVRNQELHNARYPPREQ